MEAIPMTAPIVGTERRAMSLSPEEFWGKMCDPGFRRVSAHEGVNADRRYVTEEPPEHVDGFIEDKIVECVGMLGSRRTWSDEILFFFILCAPLIALVLAYATCVVWLWS